MRFSLYYQMVLILLYAQAAWAHPGPRIWVDVQDNKVVTLAGAYPPGNPADYHPSIVFTQALADEGGDIWDTDFPGFQMVPGGHIPANTTFGYNITGPLLYFSHGDAGHCPFFESVFVRFAGTSIPQMAITNELLQTQVTSDGFVAGDALYAYRGNAGDHNHATYTLLGDGTSPAGGPDGIYALPLQLTAGGFTSSETFYLLLVKNASTADLAAAADIMVSPRVRPDLDCDGDVDVRDLELFEACVTGPSIPLHVPAPAEDYCVRADFDDDHDVDQADFARFQLCYGGAGHPPDFTCDD